MNNVVPSGAVRGMFLGVGLALLLWSVIYGLTHSEDFTDTGVGCIDDCLEPVKE